MQDDSGQGGQPDLIELLLGAIAKAGAAVSNSQLVRDGQRVRAMPASPLRSAILHGLAVRRAHGLAKATVLRKRPTPPPRRERRPACVRPRAGGHRTPRATRGPPDDSEDPEPHHRVGWPA